MGVGFRAGMLTILYVLVHWLTFVAGWIVCCYWVPPMATFLNPIRVAPHKVSLASDVFAGLGDIYYLHSWGFY